jgi:type IV pilus assembly protein PilB
MTKVDCIKLFLLYNDFMLNQSKTLLDVLVEEGKIDPAAVTNIQAQLLQTGSTLEEVLLQNNIVDENTLLQALSKLNSIPIIRLAEVGAAPEALALVSVDLSRRYQMFPFALDDANNAVLVAMADPLDLPAIQFVAQKTGKQVVPHYVNKAELAATIEQAYSNNLSAEVTEALNDTDTVVKVKSVKNFSDLAGDGIIKQAPIAKIVEQILGFAVGSGASDIHIEPQTNRIRVRYRIDGILVEKLILPRSVADSLVSRIKILAKLKIDEKRVPQDGRFGFSSERGEVDLRISTLPTVHGEKIVIRLLRKQEHIATLEELGMGGLALKNFMEAISVPQGIILVTGPTGSGKTTTLYSALHIVNKIGVNILTVEDPVEFEMAGVSQVQVNNQAGLTFASALRAFLRQDPDIIMVGEIRDHETASLAVQASLTGHLVFSTLHTNSAAGAVPRLIDMGIEPFLLASSINLVMAQRVVRKLDPDNSEEYQPTEPEVMELKKVLGKYFDAWIQSKGLTIDQLRLRRAKPNLQNKDDAYKGRVAVFEITSISPQIQELITKNVPAQELEKVAVSQGMLLMKQDGYLKVMEGITTIDEVVRVADT